MSDVKFDVELINKVKFHLKYKYLSLMSDMLAEKSLIDGEVNEKVVDELQSGTFISGGCIASLLLNEPVNDYDMYFTNETSMNFFKEWVTTKTNNKMVKDVNGNYDGFILKGKVITPNAITLSNKFQMITVLYGEPKTVTDTFDYEHCRAFYIPSDNKLFISPSTYNCIMNKKLVKRGPERKYSREDKFIKRGWSK